MTEAKNKLLVRKQLEKEGYICWYPPVSRFAPKFNYCEGESAKDIFTLFDCIALKDSELRFIQYTSHKNRHARVKKINNFFVKWNVFIGCEVWGIRDDKSYEIICI